MKLLICFALCAGAAGTGSVGQRHAAALLQTYDKALEESSSHAPSPVDKATHMLKAMAHSLDKELQEDESLHDKAHCWCETTIEEKSADVDRTQGQVDQLTQEVEAQKSNIAEFKAKIQELKDSIEDNRQTLNEAHGMRIKQQTKFNNVEPETEAQIKNLDDAIMILEQHSNISNLEFSQMSLSLLSVRSRTHRRSPDDDMRSLDALMLHSGMDMDATPPPLSNAEVSTGGASHGGFLQSVNKETSSSGLSTSEMAVVQKAMRSAKAFLQGKGRSEYQPTYHDRSSEIVGVLRQMLDEMQSGLDEAKSTETEQAQEYEQLKTSKQSEMSSAQKMSDAKQDELAAADTAFHQAKRDLKTTSAALADSQVFLKNLKQTCADADSDFEDRKKSRQEEIKAVSEAIGVLTSDDAKDAFKESYTFVQVSSSSQHRLTRNRRAAATVVRKLVSQGHPEFSALATAVEMDTFAQIEQAINTTVSDLRKDQKDEIKKNDYCVEELQQIKVDKVEFDAQQKDMEAQLENEKAIIEKLSSQIDEAKLQVAQYQVNLQAAAKTRLAENADFQKTVADQRVTQEILKKAMEKLSAFFGEPEVALIQEHKKAKHQGVNIPVQQKEYQKSSSVAIQVLMKQLIADSVDVDKQAVKGEQKAQAEYEELVVDTSKSIAPLVEDVTAKSADKAAAKKQSISTQHELSDIIDQLDHLEGERSESVHKECDYLIKNFAVRQTSRAAEIDELMKAWAFLKGQKAD